VRRTGEAEARGAGVQARLDFHSPALNHSGSTPANFDTGFDQPRTLAFSQQRTFARHTDAAGVMHFHQLFALRCHEASEQKPWTQFGIQARPCFPAEWRRRPWPCRSFTERHFHQALAAVGFRFSSRPCA